MNAAIIACPFCDRRFKARLAPEVCESLAAQATAAREVANVENDTTSLRLFDRWSPKERQTVALVVEGHRNKEIAAILDTTEQVIKNRMREILVKAGVEDRLMLAVFVFNHPLLRKHLEATLPKREVVA